MNLELILDIGAFLIPLIAGFYYLVRKTIIANHEIEQLKKEVNLANTLISNINASTIHDNLSVREDLRELSSRLAKIEGRLSGVRSRRNRGDDTFG